MQHENCPFCSPDTHRIFYRDALVIGLWDRFPVTPGHALLIPIRHISTWFDASSEEQAALVRAINAARFAIESHHAPDGYNIGINCGEASGQTIFHLHVHVIPRQHGDVIDPRGGVRHVIPDRANYVRDVVSVNPSHHAPMTRALVTGGLQDSLLPHLKHHLAASNAVDIAVAFTLRSGVELLQAHLQDLLDRHGKVRILTGDYLGTTDPDALLRLLDLQGDIECRIFQTNGLSSEQALASTFHPKAYLFHHRDGTAAAFIGSSNLSQTALTDGVEWNYRVHPSRDPRGWSEIQLGFNALFTSANTVPLTAEWIARYRDRRQRTPHPRFAEVIPDGPVEIPTPHIIQQEALRALEQTRQEGHRAALVVLATGLGKTWLSAFDSQNFRRVLFVAHREEILTQALATFRAIRPHDNLGRYTGGEKSPAAAVLFASIQTLSRQVHLDRFAKDEFDYLIIDEFHHAEAPTYRRLIEYFTPQFLLSLTATPERTDGADLLALCENNLAYRCDLTEGIRQNLLCPFRYFGVPDAVDYRNIPWRNKKFDETALTQAVATQARAANALEHYRAWGGQRTLAFCVSQRHADFMAAFFVQNGIPAKAVHAGPTSAPRAESLEALREGSLPVICAVDLFNEGVDVPELDTVMMLRPTESRILWLQQFGRGLRRSDPEKQLTVIDYIGNHRSFLLKPQALFGLSSRDRDILNLLDRLDAGTAELPPGCTVTYQLEAKNILRALLRTNGSAVELLTRRYQDFRDTLGVRPTAAELLREGYNPRILRPVFGSWLSFVQSQDGLHPNGTLAYTQAKTFLDTLETTEMTKSYKMLVLLAMLNRNQLPGTLPLAEIAQEVTAIAQRDPRIAADLGDALNSPEQLNRLLTDNPIDAWIQGKGTGGIRYFGFQKGTLSSTLHIPPNLAQSLQELAREIVDWRLADYFSRPGQTSSLHPGGTNVLGTIPYKAYRRPEIAPLFGLPYSERYWGQGFVRQDRHTFLFVTLDKTDHTAAFQYQDHFRSATHFQWQSQNRTSQDSDAGGSIRDHRSQGITVHLFVRAKAKTPDGRGAPFYYCGPVEFDSWSGNKPITVIWKLSAPVPHPLWAELGVSS